MECALSRIVGYAPPFAKSCRIDHIVEENTLTCAILIDEFCVNNHHLPAVHVLLYFLRAEYRRKVSLVLT